MKRLTYATVPLLATAILVAAAGCTSSSSSGTSGNSNATFTTIDETTTITAGAPMNPFNAKGNVFPGYDQMTLGFSKNAPDPNDYYPGLASSWTSSPDGTTFTVTLQKNAKWSDGKPVTPQDVIMSMAIEMATLGGGTALSPTSGLDLASATAQGSNQVVFKQIDGGKNLQFPNEILKQTVVPQSVYGSMVPGDIWQTITASEYTGTDPTQKAAATAAQKTLTQVSTKVSAFAPAKDVSAGPFVIRTISPGAALLDRNKYFYDVKKISPAHVQFRAFNGNQQIDNYLISGQLDMAPYVAMATNVYNQVLAKKGNRAVSSPSYVDAEIGFNESYAPYDKVQVRQAIAYILDRKAITKVGEPVSGTAQGTPSGMIQPLVSTWLGDKASALNAYNPDKAKATQLLQSAGLTQVGGKWMLPDGKPWTINLETVNGFSDWIAASAVVQSELNDFGIPTKTSVAADFATYQKNMAAGQYAVGWWLGALGPTPYQAYFRYWGQADGFTQTSTGVSHSDSSAAGNWVHTPVTYTDVPNMPAVNPGDITNTISLQTLEAQQNNVATLAQIYNYEMPMVPIWYYTNVQFVNDTRFTNFPPESQGGLLRESPGVWMMQGYVQAK
jgi:peptide/nickel transport system substrate-binding protein